MESTPTSDLTALADRGIDALAAHHDTLARLVGGLDDDALTGPSAASEWRLCDVLSHLGSGSEIMLRPFLAVLTGESAGDVDNQSIWDRWNAASPREQATWFLEHDATLVAALTGLSAEQRASITIDLGFLPQPVPLAVAVGMRLNEVALHTWDVAAGLDATATVDPEAADVLLTLFSGTMGFLLGFIGHADALDEPVEVDLLGHGLVIGDAVTLTPSVAEPTATFVGTPESAVRLLSGRLGAGYTPAGVDVTGAVTLDDLRRVFTGF